MKAFPDMLEWVLMGLTTDAAKKYVSIALHDYVTGSHTLSCEGVVTVRATDFLLHNVVESLTVWHCESFDEQAIEDNLWDVFYGYPCNRSDEGWRANVQNSVAQIKSGKNILLKLEPIYGAEVIVFAEALNID